MFSKDFLNVLANLGNYTDKVILKYPVTVLNSPAQDVFINVSAESLGCQSFEPMGVYELSKLLKVFGLFENPEVTREANLLKLQTTTESAELALSDLELLKEYDSSKELIDRLDAFPSVSEFTLTTEALKTLKSAGSILSELNALRISGKSGNTTVDLYFHNRFNSTQNSYKREFLGTSTQDFELKLGIENIQKLPITEYQVKVKFNAEKNAYRVIFVSEFFTVLIGKLSD